MKKLLSFLITAAMTISCIMVPVHAEDEIEIMRVETPEQNGSGLELMTNDISDITLTPEQIQAVNEQIRDAVINRETDIDFSELNLAYQSNILYDVLSIMQNFFSDYPEYFYVSLVNGEFTASHSKGVLKSFDNVLVYRNYENQTIDERIKELEAKRDSIYAEMAADGIDMENTESRSQFDKILWLHDYIVNHFSYDMRAVNGTYEDRELIERDLDDILLGDCVTVCEGYSEAYKYLLNGLNIDCVNVYSDMENHQWSAVKIGGSWYYVDTTQDDPTDPEMLGVVKHDFFLVTKDELLGGQEFGGTHEDGYITECVLTDSDFGTEYEGKPWHGHFEAVIDDSGEQVIDSEDNQPVYEWIEGNITTAVVFNGNDRYYCGFIEESDGYGHISKAYSEVYKCDNTLDNTTEFYEIPDSIWYANKEKTRIVMSYHGGIGKYVYKNENDGGTYLFFNSPYDIYRLNLSGSDASAESVFSYEPADDIKVNCLLGFMIDGSDINYQTANINTDNIEENKSIFENIENHSYTLENYSAECTVTFMDGDKQTGEAVIVPQGEKITVPEYWQYGKTITGWTTDEAGENAWDFDTPVTEDMTLYAQTKTASWQRTGNVRPINDLLVGTLTMEIGDFNTDYQEVPVYILAVYENNVLTAVRESADGTFNFTKEDNVVYNDGTTTVKAYAWSEGKLIPYLNPMNITFRSNPSGEGGGEDSGESGSEIEPGTEGEDSGESGGENTGSETGDITMG